ncbi:hypothetical protein pEaSNUABM10_00011 [Erwinia phage pEa_SNUABM_10]|jgi:hypothetical protein|nr:hypothetical protein pEaSNUABM43_00009 [Erwinia phage pEa_SNUABM_43]QVW55334.1 hypothetical protein pEaSNUABM42_00009 [Erwinia phage pEa_SNUABM_42]QVW55884.1 hypothetical protein pEaSNUABM10_00011 [Erwinia phage pEa_SNUABM_10]
MQGLLGFVLDMMGSLRRLIKQLRIWKLAHYWFTGEKASRERATCKLRIYISMFTAVSIGQAPER